MFVKTVGMAALFHPDNLLEKEVVGDVEGGRIGWTGAGRPQAGEHQVDVPDPAAQSRRHGRIDNFDFVTDSKRVEDDQHQRAQQVAKHAPEATIENKRG